MTVYFCRPEITMKDTVLSKVFFDGCREVLDDYLDNVQYIMSDFKIQQLISFEINKHDIFVFFNSENGEYNNSFEKILKRFCDMKSRIWPIAMWNTSENRMPPEVAKGCQSFDVSCVNENRNPHKNNMRAIAQLLARKVIAQTLTPLYQDRVLYFISHRRSDGESLAARLSDELKLLTRDRNIFRDVIDVAVGDDAQREIDDNLKNSDTVIFLQTKEASNSDYIMKELCYAIIHDIPVLWIQIDDAPYDNLRIRPSESPMLKYKSVDFEDAEKLIDIAEKVEEMCFRLMMNSSSQVFSYIEYLKNLADSELVSLQKVNHIPLAYELSYKEVTIDRYDEGERSHFIQCYGRNPKPEDLISFEEKAEKDERFKRYQRIFLLSNHGHSDKMKGKILHDSFDAYLSNIEKVCGNHPERKDKRIIISGAFPECDEIYKQSLTEAIVIYSREIIRRGYILVFGAHPTFQELIFEIGRLYAPDDVRYSIEMHMSRQYIHLYNINELKKKCSLMLDDNLIEMRKSMICDQRGEVLICLGGLIKKDKTQQGLDVEINLARSVNIPVALVGTVGGRSSEYAFEKILEGDWSNLNSWGENLNEELFYNVNHRLMARRIIEQIDK